MKKDIEEHLRNCEYAECPHKKYGWVYKHISLFLNHMQIFLLIIYSCKFCGTVTELDAHMANCQFEVVKDYLKVVDERINELQVYFFYEII